MRHQPLRPVPPSAGGCGRDPPPGSVARPGGPLFAPAAVPPPAARTPEAHRLLRRYHSTREEVLSTIFEELELEDPSNPEDRTIHTGTATRRCADLHAVDTQIAHHAGEVVVADPFGHRYLPHTPADRRLARRLRGRPLYIEIAPPGLEAEGAR